MLVYGDQSEPSAPARNADLINRTIAAAQHKSGLDAHVALVSALVDAGRLLQGVADADFAEEHCERRTAARDQLGRFLLDLGRAVCRSWDSGFREAGELPRLQHCGDWPAEVELRQPEGFAFYAVYPEAYIEAARRLRLGAPARVIGIRSIGTALGAVVAAALDAPPAMTVRPFGDAYDRRIAIDAELERELIEAEAHYVIVDEGPGQSGSSFGAVADWLQERGVPNDRIAVLPSHGGVPGPAAADERRRWWRAVQKQAGDFGDRWPELVAAWASERLGQVDSVRDLSGGAWRLVLFDGRPDWPAAVPTSERRKYLVRARDDRFLVKFAGLGGIGEEKLAIARALHAEGFTAEPVALAHGFLIERWLDDAQPLSPGENPITEIGRYIGMRARLLPAMRGSGATAPELLAMIRRNVAVESGREPALDTFSRRVDDLERRIVRVRTDNKLDRQEWLRTSGGALIKTDPLDHHQAHDLIGCQDVAWDVAGAVVEFGLDGDAAASLIAMVEESGGRAVDRDLLSFYRIAYPAFRLGQARLAQASISDPHEHARLDAVVDRYAAELQHLLESTGSRLGTIPRSVEHRNEPPREQSLATIG